MSSADKPNWIEVSFLVHDEQAETVAEILSRFAPQGVAIEKYIPKHDPLPSDINKVYAFILADEHLAHTKQKIEEAVWHLSQIQLIPKPTYHEIYDRDWMTSWKKHYYPIPVGKKLLILPVWVKAKETNRTPIYINPSKAFGTGIHPSTQLCLTLMETYVMKDEVIIDIGCGSGILSISAILLGASHALAVDISAAAVKSTKENAVLNKVENKIEVEKGSLQEIINGQFSTRDAPLVIVNILAKTILQLLEQDLTKVLTENGILILSGILDSRASEITSCAETHNLRLLEEKKLSGWAALSFLKEEPK